MSDRSARPSARVRAAAQEAARRGADAFSQRTRGLRALPTFLIAGAQRCGTTSLFKALTQHPAVLGPVLRKGVHYFDVAHHRGLDWYRGHFPLRARTRPRRGRPRVQVGESSPYYLFHPLAAERIARELPGVRIIVALRDPVQRAYSAHEHERARGFETEPFEHALRLEEERLAGTEERLRTDPAALSHSHRHHGYLARGRYAEQLERLEKHLGRDRMLVVDSAEFFADPEPVFAEIEAFLGLPHRSGVRFERHNARPRADMDPALRARLEEYFAPHDERLAAWWGRTPSWRR
ncbi:sulfotransferase domain-containing protein [Marinitenerispora sediminis]|uniref:Sulfotransferase n=1 Tax=Marinitenerispora sediminis TaxID=1931232 RepID=A0A368T7V2_9ACTN|nr:sulfotransferase [Marinitenerispora sediminis]RCV56025.1 sulfotransferase [Marinitenerispora sediminis]RCV60245.1 sulfotransferase [Marinitenerispora sediminis]RCV60987.1 sulfotransferase [Marinitenerispora sediminis]